MGSVGFGPKFRLGFQVTELGEVSIGQGFSTLKVGGHDVGTAICRSAAGESAIPDPGRQGTGYRLNLFPGIASIIQLTNNARYGHGMDRSSVIYTGRDATWGVSIVGNRGAPTVVMAVCVGDCWYVAGG